MREALYLPDRQLCVCVLMLYQSTQLRMFHDSAVFRLPPPVKMESGVPMPAAGWLAGWPSGISAAVHKPDQQALESV